MIDRLGKLGEKALDKTKTFNQLLVPSAASEWDIGRLGKRKEVSKKLMGRLSAYSRMYQLSKLEGKELVSFTFLDWLSDSCQASDISKKSKSKKERTSSSPIFTSLDSAGSILRGLSEGYIDSTGKSGTQLGGDASTMARFLPFRCADQLNSPTSLENIEEVSKFLYSIFERNELACLDQWLNDNFSWPTLSPNKKRKEREVTIAKIRGEELAFLLLRSFSELERKVEGLGSSILKWVPMLSIRAGTPELWKLLFGVGQKPSFIWSSLIMKCCQCWSRSHVMKCRNWILAGDREEELELGNVVRFLVHTSSLGSLHVECFAEASLPPEDSAWARSEDLVVRASCLALDCLVTQEGESIQKQLCSRDEPPECVVLLLLIARMGRKQLQCISQAVVERIQKGEEENRAALLAVILRLYAYYPQSMNLGVAILRSVLKEAVEAYSRPWLTWRSPLDDQFQDMTDSVIANNGSQKLVQALSDVSKKHPLLMLRKLGIMEYSLEMDAMVRQPSATTDKRGVLYGHSLNDPLPAKVNGRMVKLSVKHWGFNFTENIWLAFFDIVSAGMFSSTLSFPRNVACALLIPCLSSVPREVLFECGTKMGLLNFLGVYLRLMFVQTQLRTSDRLSRLKGKMSEFFDAFKASNIEGWEKWLATEPPGLPSLGGTRNVLMSCNFISHQQAIDSLKRFKEQGIDQETNRSRN